VNLAGVVVEDQNSVDAMARLMASITGFTIADGDDGSKYCSSARLNDPAGAPLIGWIAVAGLARRRIQPKLLARSSLSAGVPLGAIPVEEDHLFDARLLAKTLDHTTDKAAIVFDHLMLERDPNEIALRKRSNAGRFEKALEMMSRVDVSASSAGNHRSSGNAHSQTNGRAGKSQLHAFSRLRPVSWHTP
jgi:hypothetical protein